MKSTIQFKKIAVAALAVLTLAACTPQKENKKSAEKSPKTEQTAQQELKATFTIQDGKETVAEKTATFEEGATVFEVLDDTFEVDAEKSEFGWYVKAIDGVAEDTDAGKYWMYAVNGKAAEVGAGEYELKDGDQVTWTLEAM